MDKQLPDEHIRAAIYDKINGIEVMGNTINCYDFRVSGKANSNYILISSQSNEVNNANKCESYWESNILIEIYTRYPITGNTGSRLLADRILNEVRDLTNDLELSTASGLKIISQKQSFPSDLDAVTNNEILFRKFIRIELTIN